MPALQAALTDAEVGLFLPESVRTVTDATASEMLIELERFFTSAHRDDTTLLFYSGHGLLDDANRLYLCARDTRSDLMRATAVSADGLNGMIDASASQTTVIMLDCCYSGAFKSGQLPDSLRGTGRYLLTSCRGSQLANDASEAHGTSMFTEHLVEGLRGAAPDANHDGYVNLSDIYDYVHGALAAESRQIPQRNFAGGGDVTIARRPAANDQDADGAGGADLDLSETVIDLRDVRPGEPLPTERVYVRSRRGAPLDWTTHTDADWLELVAYEGYFTVDLRPRPGVNRGNVVVRDRLSGETQTVRLRVEVVAAEGPAADRLPGTPQDLPAPQPAPPTTGGRRPSVAVLAGFAAVVLLAVVVVSALLPGGGGEGNVVADRRVRVPADVAWTDTGIDLRVGDEVAIAATGTVTHAPDVAPVGPDGDPRIDIRQFNVAGLEDVNHAALIARKGDGAPFFVGAELTFSAQAPGRLQLRVNDLDGGLFNNGGAFAAQVTVTRS